jgi:oligoendopeptidase F
MSSSRMTSDVERVRWNLSDLVCNDDATAAHRDLTESLAAAQRFARRYRGRVVDLDSAALAVACREQEAVLMPLHRVLAYAELRVASGNGDERTEGLLACCHQQLNAVAAEMTFFELEWSQVDNAHAEGLIATEDLASYRHFLARLRCNRSHRLSEAEERILTTLSYSSTTAWERLFSRLVGSIQVEFEGATHSIGKVLPVLYDLDSRRRRNMHEAVSAALEKDLQTRAFVFNVLVSDKATRDQLRGYEHWLHSQHLANEVSHTQVRTMLDVVKDCYGLVARYYRLKTRLLGVTELYDFDRYAPLPNLLMEHISWKDAKEVVLDAYGSFTPEFQAVAAEFFDRRWIDAAPRLGKQGGAFARAVTPDTHPYVMLNFNGRLRDVLTLAHELGHAVHMRLAQRQTLANMDAPLVLAETASLFCETLVIERLLQSVNSVGVRLGLLARHIEDLFVTVFRQTAMHDFEEAVHTGVHESGELSASAIGDEWLRTQAEMFQGTVSLTQPYAMWWSYINHFFLAPGSVYAYVFGTLVALALYHRYKDTGTRFVKAYLEVLAAGGSQPPSDTLATLGVNLDNPWFWKEGLWMLQQYVQELERLAASYLRSDSLAGKP